METTMNGTKNGHNKEFVVPRTILSEALTAPPKNTNGTTKIGSVVARWMTVTPSLASEWLKKNRQNRNINKTKVARFAATMKNGRWKVVHQGVALDINGVLIDGQHRLLAVVAAGVPIMMLVTTGLDPIARAATDVGDPRGPHHLIAIIGVNGISREDSALVSKCVNMIRSGAWSTGSKQDWEDLKTDVLKYRNGIRWAIERCDKPLRKELSQLRSGPVLGAFVFAFPAVDPGLFNEVHEEFESGLFSRPCATKLLREHVLAGRVSSVQSSRGEVFRKTLTAIYHRVNNTNLKKLLSNENAVDYFKGLYK